MTRPDDGSVRCTACHATGTVPAFICLHGGFRPVACSRCQGTGWLPPDFEERLAAGHRLRTFRNELGLSLGEAARLIPCAVTTLSAAETGKMPPGHVAVFVKVLTEIKERRANR